ncbi:MAG: alkaline phosphatase family protein [Parvularculaceae bacterium]
MIDKEDPAHKGNDARVFMACIDSMSLPFARAHLESLPVLKSMIAGGALLELSSPGGVMSASMWPTFTGCLDPGEHGQYHPFQWDAEAMNFRRIADKSWSDRFYCEPFWHALARDGVETIVLDPGFVLRDEAAPGIQISNWSGQETGVASASDPAILSELRRRFGRRPIGREVPVPKSIGESRKIRNDLIAAVRAKSDAILWLMTKRNWRFFFAGFFEAHRAGHNLWPTDGAFASDVEEGALLDVYREVDRQLARVFEAAAGENTTFILFALHGMDENRVQNHLLPQIMSRLNALYLKEKGQPSRARGGGADVVSLLRKVVPFNIQYALAKSLGEGVQDWVVNRGLTAGLDWERTPAFHLAAGGEGYLRFNVKGRERLGYFEPDGPEIKAYEAWLRERLLRIKVAGADASLIKNVLSVRDLFVGGRSQYLPDLVLDWAPSAPAETIVSPDIGKITERLTTGRGGNHTGDSFMIVKGPGAASRTLSEVAHIKDIGGYVVSLYRDDAVDGRREAASFSPRVAEIA